jgi:hypothetical protein
VTKITRGTGRNSALAALAHSGRAVQQAAAAGLLRYANGFGRLESRATKGEAMIRDSEAEAPGAPGEFESFGGSPFKLWRPYAPAGDQPAAIGKLVEGLNDGLSFQTLLGVTGSGKTFTMANVIARLGRPAIVFSATCSSRRTARSTSTSSRCA